MQRDKQNKKIMKQAIGVPTEKMLGSNKVLIKFYDLPKL